MDLLAGSQIDDRDRMAALVTTIEPLGFFRQGQRDRPGATGDSTDHGPLFGIDQGDRVYLPLSDVKDFAVGRQGQAVGLAGHWRLIELVARRRVEAGDAAGRLVGNVKRLSVRRDGHR